MRVLNAVSSLFLLAISLSAQAPPQKPAAKSQDLLFREIKFVGVRQVPLAELRRVAAIYEGEPLGASQLSELEERVRDLYMQHGFFKAQITRDETATSGSGVQPTPIVYQVVEGKRYRLGSIRFENGKAFAPAVLRPRFPMRAGEIFNVSMVRKGLENLRRLYGTRGYLNFTPVPDTSVDDDAATVSLIIDLDEGKQFRVASVKIFGLDWDRTARLLCRWPLKPGAIYRYDAVERFFIQSKAWLPRGSRPELNPERQMSEKSGTVDVFLNFSDVDAPTVEVQAKNPHIEFSGEKAQR